MAVGGAEVAGLWPLSSGFFSLLILLFLLSIFLTTLCSDCARRSFELQDAEVERSPSSLIQVVKLEDAVLARENPMINEIRNEEQEGSSPAVSELKPEEENSTWFKPWRSHLGALQNQDVVQINGTAAATKMGRVSASEGRSPTVSELKPEEENLTWFKPWRSHLGALQNQDISSPPFSELHHSPAPTATVKVNPSLMSVLPPISTGQDALNCAVSSRDSGLRVGENQEARPSLEVCPHVYHTIKEKGGGRIAFMVEPGVSSIQNRPNSTTSPEPPSAQEEGIGAPGARPLVEEVEEDLTDKGWNPMYAKVSRKGQQEGEMPPPPEEDEEE